MVEGLERLDAMGMIGLGQLKTALRNMALLKRVLQRTPLDLVVFIDNPGMNLRLARVAKRVGLRVVYYVSPQIWAWRPGRIHLISRVVDRMIVILPFEEALYRKAGVSCDFVGHPLLDAVAPSYDRADLRKRFGHDDSAPLLGLLPGSREQEVRSLLPTMLQAAGRLALEHPGLGVLIAQAVSIPDSLLESVSRESGVHVNIIRDQPNEVMAAADLLLVASGTATLQAAVIGTPMIIMYRTTWLTYWLARMLIRIRCIGLVNIVAGTPFVTELIQDDVNVDRVTQEADRLLRDPAALDRMRARLRAVRDSLGAPGASRRAAAAVLAECRA
jgi:lipid-A-disaccharide synthase